MQNVKFSSKRTLNKLLTFFICKLILNSLTTRRTILFPFIAKAQSTAQELGNRYATVCLSVYLATVLLSALDKRTRHGTVTTVFCPDHTPGKESLTRRQPFLLSKNLSTMAFNTDSHSPGRALHQKSCKGIVIYNLSSNLLV